MLNIAFNRQNFDLRFDVPLPLELSGEPELRAILDGLCGSRGCKLIADANYASGIQGTVGSLLDLLQSLLPPAAFSEQQRLISHAAACEQPQSDGLQINFHQQSFDTELRYWRFIIDQGYFADYFVNRLNWYLAPRTRFVTDFPLHVDVESASTCNMNCPMCYRAGMENYGQINEELFRKVIDECSAHDVFSVRLSWRGETLTHPRIKELISYACAKIKNVSFLTNAFYITEDMADCFIANGVSYVAVSFDGIGGTYEAIRRPAKYQESLQKLRVLRNKREAIGARLPRVRACTIWPAVKSDPSAYQEALTPVSDYMVCNPYINFRGPMTLKPGFVCQYPWERIVVAWDGKVQCCTGWNAQDILLGSAGASTIQELWKSERMEHIRRLHAEGRRLELQSCADCRHGSQGDPNINIAEILERRY